MMKKKTEWVSYRNSRKKIKKQKESMMGLFGDLEKIDFDQGLEQYENTKGARLIDVRTPEEYSEGRVPGSINFPLQDIHKIETLIEEKEAPLFVYCLSGARSSQAVMQLIEMGYENVINIGGINDYHGMIEK